MATTRGRNGGLELAMAPGEIGLGAVFRPTEGNCELVECLAVEERNGWREGAFPVNGLGLDFNRLADLEMR